jgi:hypothetical protein
MSRQDKPMPLKDLPVPAYLDSVRERGQGDDIPVVDMGMIVDAPEPFNWFRVAAYSAAACLMVAVGAVGYAVTETKSIVIDAGDISPAVVADIVSGEGGRVFSATQMEDGTCEVRFFTLKKTSSFLEQLRSKKEFLKVEIK